MKTEIRILMLEDVATDAELVQRELHRAGIAFSALRVQTRNDFERELDDFRPDIVLADYRLPGFDGLSAVRLAHQSHPHVPVIMVTGALGDEGAVDLLKAGARDYVLKDRLSRLGPAIERTLQEEESIRSREAAELAQRKSEAGLEEAQRLAQIGSWSWDIATDTISWSTQYYRIYNLEPGTPPPNYAEHLKVYAAEGARALDAAVKHTLQTGEPYALELELAKPDVAGKWIFARGEAKRDAQGRFTRLAGTAQDITERKRAERALARAHRALRTLSSCNEALVRAKHESELLHAICRLVVETGGYAMAWVGYAESDAAKTVRPAASYGDASGFLASAQFSWADTALGLGPTGTAIRGGTIQINRDFDTDPQLAPWREAALSRGYRSSIALPLTGDGGTFGALTIDSAERDAFGEDEVRLLRELADDLAFGVETLRTRAERDRISLEHEHHEAILRHSLEESIKAIASTVEMRDPYTAGHQRRVGQLAAAIARELGLEEETIHGIDLAAGIHDLGKIHVPAEILSKPGKLSDIEFSLIKTHPQSGYDIVKDVEFPWPIARAILQHHERLDGSGYPNGLKGDEILLEARIIAVADVVEAMSSHRPYRPAKAIDAALAEIERGMGTLYDAQAAQACLKLFREGRFDYLNSGPLIEEARQRQAPQAAPSGRSPAVR